MGLALDEIAVSMDRVPLIARKMRRDKCFAVDVERNS
jgi:hypothetical protein